MGLLTESSGATERWGVVANYEPQADDEIPLKVGNTVVITFEYDDGWALGRNETTSEVGLLPLNFVKKLNDDSPVHQKSEGTRIALARTSSLMEKRSTGTQSARFLSGVSDLAAEDRKPKDVKAEFAAVKDLREGRSHIPSNIGVLRIAVAGDSGIGKTCLIKRLLNIPEIVKISPTTPIETSSIIVNSTQTSTIPDDDLHMGEEKLNLTFYDTPGFGIKTDASLTIAPITNYMTSQFAKTDEVFAPDAAISDRVMVRLLNAGTGAHTHIDVLLYCFLHRVKPVDIEYIRRLSPCVNVIPIITKSDTLRPSEIFALKISILEELARADIKVYAFGMEQPDLIDLARDRVLGVAPFATWIREEPGTEVGEDEGGQAVVDEFEALKDGLLYGYVDDFRQSTAEMFVKWRRLNQPK
ncbi:hypothetical protein HK104_000750 [Borealophlyctis nickersoniae]|nr:hypothetical protein HK104_000750 [Borealophlyctis nickersoniae]